MKRLLTLLLVSASTLCLAQDKKIDTITFTNLYYKVPAALLMLTLNFRLHVVIIQWHG